ncbi:hypothetical protein WH47_12153 [Habropoda laboriosa]|uniref:Uncharacterized protein n=1 Tax=Habropoda laboriosa TaxID=597456 RepID=A0A0L7RAE1_9HYME|nr:hypothetical protein WH47_12153 [Habropoda laboriosa]
MILNSSFKHHTASMRLLFIALTCLAACSALPQPKQKRDILPGDPRYDSSHHHSHENAIENAKSSPGYAFPIPKVPHEAYGPPGFEPGVPLSENLFKPVIDVEYSTPVPTHGIPDSVHIPDVIKKCNEPHDVHLEKPITAATVSLPLEELKSVAVTPPSTSYGISVLGHVKTTDKSEIGLDSHVKTIETVKTKLDSHEVVDVHTPTVKVVEHAPITPEVTHITSGVKTVPTLTTTLTKDVNPWLNGDISGIQTSLGGTFDIPTIDLSYGLSSGLYNFPQSTFDAYPNGYNSYSLSLPSVEVPPSLPLPLHDTKGIPTGYPFSPDIKIPRTDLQVPYSLAHFIQRTQPAHILQSLPSGSSFESFSSPLHPVPSPDTLSAAHPLSYADTLTRVHADASVKAIGPLPSVEHTLPAIPSAKSVETVSTVHPVPTVNTVHPVESLSTLHPLPTVKSLHPVDTISAYHSLPAVKSIHSVETAIPSLHVAPTLPTVHPLPPVETIPSHHVTPTVDALSAVHSFPTVKTIPSLHGVFSHFSHFTTTTTTTAAPTTSTTTTAASTTNRTSYHITDDLHQGGIAIDNPFLSIDDHLVSAVTSANEYVQPTDINGGYIYRK